MPSFSEPHNPTLFSQSCSVADGTHEPHINKNEALHVEQSCENPLRVATVTCKDPHLQEFIDDVDGLALDKKISGIADLDIPTYIPIADLASSKLSNTTFPSDVVGMTLKDVMSSGVKYIAGTMQEHGQIAFRTTLLLGEALRGKKNILFASESDTLIERLWRERKGCRLFDTLRLMGFSIMTGINFSIFKGECPMGHCLGQKKSLCSAYLAEAAGMPAIPHIYAVNPFDTARWVNYLKKNPQIKLFTMNCQLQKSRQDIKTVVVSVREILAKTAPDVRVILVGFHLPKIYMFGDFLNRIHFADKMAVKCAQSHKKITINFNTMKMRTPWVGDESISEIMTHNINQRRIYIELVKMSMFEKYTMPIDIQNLLEIELVKVGRIND
jgi:hypothetical protein